VKLSIDVVQFGKPLLSVSEPNATLSIQPAFFEAPLNSNKFQNDQTNNAFREITQFQKQQYNFQREASYDLQFGIYCCLREPQRMQAVLIV